MNSITVRIESKRAIQSFSTPADWIERTLNRVTKNDLDFKVTEIKEPEKLLSEATGFYKQNEKLAARIKELEKENAELRGVAGVVTKIANIDPFE
jgi:hypothetical protein